MAPLDLAALFFAALSLISTAAALHPQVQRVVQVRFLRPSRPRARLRDRWQFDGKHRRCGGLQAAAGRGGIQHARRNLLQSQVGLQ
jgi:hypothetical protein